MRTRCVHAACKNACPASNVSDRGSPARTTGTSRTTGMARTVRQVCDIDGACFGGMKGPGALHSRSTRISMPVGPCRFEQVVDDGQEGFQLVVELLGDVFRDDHVASQPKDGSSSVRMSC